MSGLNESGSVANSSEGGYGFLGSIKFGECIVTRRTTISFSRRVHIENDEQDRQCTYCVILRRVRESLFPWKSNKYIFVCVCARAPPGRIGVCMRMRACSLAYPAYNSYAPYCDVTCGPWGSTTFSTLCHKQYDFRKKKKFVKIRCVFWFSLQLLSEPFLRRIHLDILINVKISSCKVPVILVRF